MRAHVPKQLTRSIVLVVGFSVFLLILDQLLNLIAIYRPKRLHKATRKLLKHVNRVYLWAVYRFDLGRHSEEVILFHKGRKSGNEYATPLCVSHCDEGFIIGAYWGPTADWLLNLRTAPSARVRYQGEYHDVEAEVITLDEAHRRMGGPSLCGCWEQGRAEYCVLLRPVRQPAGQAEHVVVPASLGVRTTSARKGETPTAGIGR
jgi:deazaflavin-dependent oxidoreductase (nitroreductase family)